MTTREGSEYNMSEHDIYIGANRPPLDGLSERQKAIDSLTLAFNINSDEAEIMIDQAIGGVAKEISGSALDVQEGGGHYKAMKIQPVEYIHANGIGFCEGSVIKYVSRWRNKNGVEDLKKARHFLDLLIELEESEEEVEECLGYTPFDEDLDD